ncbi:twin-arginine translocation signal domain-containing protein [Photobacterium damselae subsp. piscicida]|nr:twin-arginine translocation signal domain-containing protein [Photobacterium damselae subsp. piscicida]
MSITRRGLLKGMAASSALVSAGLTPHAVSASEQKTQTKVFKRNLIY